MKQLAICIIIILFFTSFAFAGDEYDWSSFGKIKGDYTECTIKDDAGNNIARGYFNSAGNIIKGQEADWETDEFITTSIFEYDNSEKLVKISYAWGEEDIWGYEIFIYDNKNNLIKIEYYSAYDDSNIPYYTAYNNYAASGKLIEVLYEYDDGDNYLDTYEYDNQGRKIKIYYYSNKDNTEPADETVYEYNSESRISKEYFASEEWDEEYTVYYRYTFDRHENVL